MGEWRLPHWHGSGSSGARVAYRHAQPTPPIHLWDYFVTLGWEDSMRSIRLLAATTVILTGAWACGDGGGVGPNLDPDANFTFTPCTVGVACTFTDASSDPDGTITSRRWNFGDGSAEVVDQVSLPHIFAEAKDYTVTLTVTDNGGKSNTQTTTVTVTGGTPTNQSPTAAFTFLCTGLSCTFTNSSTDPENGTLTSLWNFGDNTTSPEASPTHAYAAANTYTVTLTVTDNLGATAVATQSVTVGSAPAQQCSSGTITTGQQVVNCDLTVAQRSTVKLILTERSCELGGNRISIAEPVAARQTAWFNACFDPAVVPAEFTIVDNGGAPMVFETGTLLRVRFTQGTAGAGSPAPGAPAGRIENAFPSWKISIDDGGNPGGPGEPDFTDLVLTVQATPQ
jgi:PKD repeat protein